jgi:hypothetical protein
MFVYIFNTPNSLKGVGEAFAFGTFELIFPPPYNPVFQNYLQRNVKEANTVLD